MRYVFLSIIVALFFPFSAHAQNENLDIVSEPICFVVRNDAPYGIFGSFITAKYENEEGKKVRHTSNFRFKAKGSIHESSGLPADRDEFCSYGPFLKGRKLEMVIKTLIPIYRCKTRIDQGEIIIRGERDKQGVASTWIECRK